MHALAWLQWPAMAVTVAATWLVGSRGARRRRVGFWIQLVGSALWIAWGLQDGAWAVVGLQLFLAAISARNARHNEGGDGATDATRAATNRPPSPPRPRS